MQFHGNIRSTIGQGTWYTTGSVVGTYDRVPDAIHAAAALAKKGFLESRAPTSLSTLPSLKTEDLQFAQGRMESAFLPIKPEMSASFLRVAGLTANSVTVKTGAVPHSR